jgi:hypothetical protein
VVGARERAERDRAPDEQPQSAPVPAPHDLIALQRAAGNHAVTRMLARMKIVDKPLRKANEGDKDVIDTDDLTDEDLNALVTRAATENMTLFEPLLNELEARHEKPKYEKEKKEVGPGGMVTMKTIYGSAHPLRGLPGLIGPPDAFIASLDKDLASDGIDPHGEVANILFWRPANTSDHVELGAVISGVYTKLHLATKGYELIHNATRPIKTGQPKPTGEAAQHVVEYASVDTIPLVNVNARLFYATFLDTANDLGDFKMDTNNCQNFASRMVRTLEAYAPKPAEKENEKGESTGSEDFDDFM